MNHVVTLKILTFFEYIKLKCYLRNNTLEFCIKAVLQKNETRSCSKLITN